MVLSEIKDIYCDYFRKADEISGKQKIFGGLFGFGKKSADDPCHEEFSEKLKAALAGAAEECSSDELREVLSYIYREPSERENRPDVYWMLIAVHSHTLCAAEKLLPEDAKVLAEEYGRCYPANKRLPVQDKVHEALMKRSRIPL